VRDPAKTDAVSAWEALSVEYRKNRDRLSEQAVSGRLPFDRHLNRKNHFRFVNPFHESVQKPGAGWQNKTPL
jgi:hypothetical protein